MTTLIAARPEGIPGADAHLILKRELVTGRHKLGAVRRTLFMTPRWRSRRIISGRDTLGGGSSPVCSAVAAGMGKGALLVLAALDKSNDSLADAASKTFSLCESSA